ncbi:MAG: carbohydrate binding family 9 domain-containing protein [Acidobacteria bacterium]|nr:carbohydrate binding family 9 domain-containing protein [Acidobacteriota bacterium]
MEGPTTGTLARAAARLLAASLTLLIVPAVHAGQAGTSAAGLRPANLPADFDGPAPPVPPATVARDASGRATIRAVRVTTPLRLDGRLDEPLYASVSPISDFIQQEPSEGAPATEKTELWLAFDDDNVYVAFRCRESEPDRLVANEMRRDGSNMWQGNDFVAISFDTFLDRRNAFVFITNALGALYDGQVTNERQWNGDWSAVWDVKTGRFDGGWSVEMAIPFKSLRYRSGRTQTWGVNALRTNRWKNELSYITRVPAARGQSGLYQGAFAATMVGLEAPFGSRALDLKPYVVSDLTTNRAGTPSVSNKLDGDAGFDMKYGLTQNLAADFTYNTDFAQIEADEQQVNLTRFSLFFPEKREFFLENQGVFAFGGAAAGASSAGGDVPVLFYSRRIGLQDGRPIPLLAGARTTGRIGRYTVGLLDIQTGRESDVRSTNFSVVRLKRDLFRRSSVGLLFTGRSVGQRGLGTNAVYGVDATLGFFDNLNVNTYWARTRTSDRRGRDTSYRGQIDYQGDRYGAQLEHLVVGDDFNPEAGFVRRTDIRRSFGQFRFSPRPAGIEAIRKFFWAGSMAYITRGDGRLDTRESNGEFAIEFQNSDRLSVAVTDTHESLPAPFAIAPGIALRVGTYHYDNVRVQMNLGSQRKVSGQFAVDRGTFYSGRKTTLSASHGRINAGSRLSLEPSFQLNVVDLAEGSFTNQIVGSRITYTLTPRMFTSALVQFSSSSHTASANVRLRWEYRPGSELFVVFNEERDTLVPRFPALANRALIVKINRLFRP